MEQKNFLIYIPSHHLYVMIVRCLNNTGQALSPFEYTDLVPSQFGRFGASAFTAYDLEVGKDYLVMGILVFKTYQGYLVDDNGSIQVVPCQLFEVVDSSTPSSWHFRLIDKEEEIYPYVQSIFGYFELCYDTRGYEDLIVEMTEQAQRIYFRRKIDLEHNLKKTLREILDEIEEQQIGLGDYLPRIPYHAFLYTNDLVAEIIAAYHQREPEILQDLLAIAARDGVNDRYTEILCEIMKNEWFWINEEIAMLLEDIRDPASVDTLYTTALNIPPHDEVRALARKCIWALVAIGTREAKEKIRQLKAANDPVINQFIKLQIGE